MRLGKKLAMFAILAATSLWAVSAKGNSVIVSFNGTLSSGTTFIYDISLEDTDAQESRIATDGTSYFTIYDLAGYVNASWSEAVGASTDWSLSTSNTGYTDPTKVAFFAAKDDSGTANVTVKYVGSSYIYTGAGVDSLALGRLTVVSQYAGHRDDWYSSKDEQAIQTGWSPGYQASETTVPSPIPVPAAVWGGLALLGLAGIRRAVRK